jgi:hypothetical protein
MPDLEREHNTIEDFCARNTLLTGCATNVIGWPDEENPGKRCCDALILRGSEQMALDHRVIESFKDHYKDNVLLKSIVSPLQESLLGLYPSHRIRIHIRVRGLPKANRDKMREDLKKGCIKALEATPDDSRIHKHYVADVPCDIWVSRTISKRPGCFVGRILPRDQDAELNSGMLGALESKSQQFYRFKDKGFYTILLLDTDDFSSLNEYMVGDAFSLAIKQCDIAPMDEVYLFYRYPDNFVILPLKIGENTYPNLIEFNLHYEKQYAII